MVNLTRVPFKITVFMEVNRELPCTQFIFEEFSPCFVLVFQYHGINVVNEWFGFGAIQSPLLFTF